MIEKIDSCIYCGKKMESERASKKFCSPQHRLYYHREIKRGTFVEPNKKEEAPPIIPEEPIKDKDGKPESQPKEEFSSFGEYRKKKMGLK